MKACTWLAAGMALAALAAWTAGAAPVKIKVLKDNVNLRARPVADAEVVGQVSAGEALEAKSMDAEWVEVVPPAHVDLWVLGDYVKDNAILSRQKVNIRSGPGINFAIVGQLEAGQPVTPRGARNDWVKIAPPALCSLWVSRPLIQIAVDPPPPPPAPAKVEPPRPEPPKPAPARLDLAAAAPVKVEPPRPASPPARAPEVKPAAAAAAASPASAPPRERRPAPPAIVQPVAPAPEPPPDLLLVDAPGQGQWKQYDGILRPRGVFARTPSRYRLVSYDKDGNGKTVCYVKGNSDQLSTLINRPMIISGREYWVQKQTYPVLVPDRIVLK